MYISQCKSYLSTYYYAIDRIYLIVGFSFLHYFLYILNYLHYNVLLLIPVCKFTYHQLGYFHGKMHSNYQKNPLRTLTSKALKMFVCSQLMIVFVINYKNIIIKIKNVHFFHRLIFLILLKIM